MQTADINIISTLKLREAMNLESTVSIAKVGTKSLRATVPEGIVAFLGIKEGDKLQWKMDIQKNSERVVIVTKKKK
jgi:bifunctional DNA-binding transcriptional regulator/antitoxin component of YhaV-PrlF toxin-antitoxin module